MNVGSVCKPVSSADFVSIVHDRLMFLSVSFPIEWQLFFLRLVLPYSNQLPVPGNKARSLMGWTHVATPPRGTSCLALPQFRLAHSFAVTPPWKLFVTKIVPSVENMRVPEEGMQSTNKSKVLNSSGVRCQALCCFPGPFLSPTLMRRSSAAAWRQLQETRSDLKKG
jgi:hypothetical protein